MSDRTTLEIIAPTVEEALSQGLAQLGLTADAVSVEVLDSGSKGLFGLGGRQVRVRLTVNPPPESFIPQKPAASEPVAAQTAPSRRKSFLPRNRRSRNRRASLPRRRPSPKPLKNSPSQSGSSAWIPNPCLTPPRRSFPK